MQGLGKLSNYRTTSAYGENIQFLSCSAKFGAEVSVPRTPSENALAVHPVAVPAQGIVEAVERVAIPADRVVGSCTWQIGFQSTDETAPEYCQLNICKFWKGIRKKF